MERAIDKAINNLNGILTEATEGENSVCYVTENDAETLQVAINIMRKYRKIEEIVMSGDDTHYKLLMQIKEVIEDGNDT